MEPHRPYHTKRFRAVDLHRTPHNGLRPGHFFGPFTDLPPRGLQAFRGRRGRRNLGDEQRSRLEFELAFLQQRDTFELHRQRDF